ncbi:MAG: META domain-containing protein [Acidobacteriota bacterium]|nr:META domain-containing protein [Acidobacteriota bacterium]
MKHAGAITFLLTLVLAGCAPLADTAKAPELDGTDWKLTAMNGNAPAAGSSITLKFEQGSATGSAGCNQYSSTYTTSGAKLEFGMTSSTKRACLEQEKNVQETAYLGALPKVAEYGVAADRLTLRDSAGAALLEYERAR